MLFRETFLNSNNPNILSIGNSRISKHSLFVECRLPYPSGGYSPALVLNDKNTGVYKVVLYGNNVPSKDVGVLKRDGNGSYRLSINDCDFDLDVYNKVCVFLNGEEVLCGKFAYKARF